MKKFLPIAILLFVTTARAAEPSKATQAAASRLAHIVLTRDNYTDKMDKMVKAIHDAQPVAKQKLLTPEFWTKLRSGIEEKMPYEEMVDDQTTQFAKSYTADELKHLITFYESTLGKKALKVMPEVMMNATANAEKRMGDRLPPLLNELMKSEPAYTKEMNKN